MNTAFFSDYLMPLAIGLMMLHIGLGLKFREFENLYTQPKSIVVGLIAQLLLLPLLGFLLAFLLPIPVSYKVGLIVIAACPGGTTSNLLTYFMRGRVPLSITLTTFNSFVILFTIPTITALGNRIFANNHHAFEMQFWETFGSVLMTILLPVITGMIFRYYFEKEVIRFRKWFQYISMGFLFLVFFVVIFFGEGSPLKSNDLLAAVIAAFILNVLSTFMGIMMAKTFKINETGQFTIGIEVGLQNSALAIYVASQLIGSLEIAAVPLVYGSFSFITTAIWIFMFKRSRSKDVVGKGP